MNPKISVIMTVYNEEDYISQAIRSVLEQDFADFEFIIVDDNSTDKTKDILREQKDQRIKILTNKENRGIANSRNKALSVSRGEYIFFTDADCTVSQDWLKKGLLSFKIKNVVGVEGYTYYVEKGYLKAIDDKLPGDVETKNQYLACNIAYRKETFDKLGKFDNKFKYHDDRDFALRALTIGIIENNREMVVKHLKKTWTPTSFIKSAKRVQDRVLLFKKHGETIYVYKKVLFPKELLKAIIPPLILLPIFKGKCKSWRHLLLILSAYPRAIYLRYLIWKTALKEKVFLI